MSDKAISSGGEAAAQLRKIKKPIIERRRRERINDSLNQLKTLVLDALNKDESRYSKMEKADILEMTVRHLKAVQSQLPVPTGQTGSAETDRSLDLTRYKAGFSECAHEVTTYLGGVQGLGTDVQTRLMLHLQNKIQHKSSANHPTSCTPLAALPGSTSTVNLQHQQQQQQQLTSAHHYINSSSIHLLQNSITPTSELTVNPTTMTSVIAVLSPASISQGAVLGNSLPLYVKPVLASPPISSSQSPVSSPSFVACSVSGSVSEHNRVGRVLSPQPGDDAPPPDACHHSPHLPQSATSPITPDSSSHDSSRIPKSTNKPSLPTMAIKERTAIHHYTANTKHYSKRGSHSQTVTSHKKTHTLNSPDNWMSSLPPKTILAHSHSNDVCSPPSDLGYSTKAVWRPW